jgi:hypothetical protein
MVGATGNDPVAGQHPLGLRRRSCVLPAPVPRIRNTGLHTGGSLSSPATKPTDDRADQDKLARALQAELKRVGCDPGNVDGVWDDKAKRALAEFARLSKVALANEAPTSEALLAVLGQKDRICALQCGPHETEKGGRCVARAKPAPTRASEETRRGPEAASEHKCKCWSPNGVVGANFPRVCPQ